MAMSTIVKNVKYYKSNNYNYTFNMKTGHFMRWGRTISDDPLYSPYGPEILDIEIASGGCKGGCQFCYKGNQPNLPIEYMDIDTYIKLFEKINVPTLTQIAFGITDIDANPDFWNILKYTRDRDIIPNYTTNGIDVTEEVAKKTKELCGAVAVSVYKHNKETAYNAIKLYTDTGMDQVNIHFMLAKETLDFAHEVLHDMNEDPRLRNMNAIVFLQYKDKNPKAHYHPPSFQEFKTLVDFCLSDMVKFGFDSCSSAMFMKAVADREDAEKLIQSVDNCESTLFSFYIDVDGNGYPCSFLQGQTEEWKEGIDILSIEDYIKDVWFNPRVIQYRKTLLNSSKNCNCKYSGMCRSCFVYDVNDCKDR